MTKQEALYLLAPRSHELAICNVILPDGNGRDVATSAMKLGMKTVTCIGKPGRDEGYEHLTRVAGHLEFRFCSAERSHAGWPGLRQGDTMFGPVTAAASLGGQRGCAADCVMCWRPIPDAMNSSWSRSLALVVRDSDGTTACVCHMMGGREHAQSEVRAVKQRSQPLLRIRPR